MVKYFKLSEFFRTSHGRNIPPDDVFADVLDNIYNLLTYCLIPIREFYGRPIYISSGYRCPAVNNAVGGHPNSQHLKGQAVDIFAGFYEEDLRLFELIVANKSNFSFDQLIFESNKYRSWIHISYNLGHNRNQILKIQK